MLSDVKPNTIWLGNTMSKEKEKKTQRKALLLQTEGIQVFITCLLSTE